MQTQNYISPPLISLMPEKPLFDPHKVAEFCEPFRDPFEYPELEKIGFRWDRAMIIACTPGAVKCSDPEKRIFLVQTESPRQEFFYRVCLVNKKPTPPCTSPDDRRHPDFACKHRLAAIIYRHFIEIRNGLEPGDLCRAAYGRHSCFATVLDVYANWIRVEVTETSGMDNHRITPFWDEDGQPTYIKWVEYGENCFLA